MEIPSHPSIIGTFRDIEYSKGPVENCLKMILCLIYGNVQMMAEGFLNLLDSGFHDIVKETLGNIGDFLKEVPLFEPDGEGLDSLYKAAVNT